MRCREMHVDENGKKTVVWFGSIGKTVGGFGLDKWDESKWNSSVNNAIFVNKTSYVDGKSALVSSLLQRLSVIKGELWYSMSYGLPLFSKNRSKVEFDSFILSTVSAHPDVKSIRSFSSNVVDCQYSCKIEIESVYGQLSLEV